MRLLEWAGEGGGRPPFREREEWEGDWGMGQEGREREERVGPVRASRHTAMGGEAGEAGTQGSECSGNESGHLSRRGH